MQNADADDSNNRQRAARSGKVFIFAISRQLNHCYDYGIIAARRAAQADAPCFALAPNRATEAAVRAPSPCTADRKNVKPRTIAALWLFGGRFAFWPPGDVMTTKILRTRAMPSAHGAVDTESRTVALSFSSETPVDMGFALETLSHEPGSMVMGERLRLLVPSKQALTRSRTSPVPEACPQA